MFRLKAVQTKADWDEFVRLPWKIYQNDPNWVPPLLLAVHKLLDLKKNPFFKHAIIYPVLAYEGKNPVGRIMGIIDHRHNQVHQEKTGFFGFFEAVNDSRLANQMFEEVASWLKSQGMGAMRGPMNPSVNHECGLLIQGFDDPPSIMMTYNPPYYRDLFENWNLSKAKDFLAYGLGQKTQFSERILKHSERLKEKRSIRLRSLDLRNFEEELKKVHEITNDALQDVWGFVPFTWEEFAFAAQDMKSIVDPRLVLMAEYHGQVVGYALALPDINQALIKIKNGKLFPTGLLSLLWNTKGPGRKKTIQRCRIALLCVKKSHQLYGIGPLLYTEYLRLAPQLGFSSAEASFVVEDNLPMNKALQMMNSEVSKVYRIYEKNLVI
jgi:GNAT superfamily N-acetyltransferase